MAAGTVQESWAALPTTAQKLLRAGIEAFGEHGFHGTSTREVAQRAGMSPAAMYMHFPTKEALLYQIARTGHEVVVEHCRLANASSADPAERVRAIVTRMVVFHAEHHGLARVIQYEHTSLTPDHQSDLIALRRQAEAYLRSAIEDGVAAGCFDPAAASMATVAVMSLTIDVARWYPTQHRRTPSQIAEAYGTLALRMLSS